MNPINDARAFTAYSSKETALMVITVNLNNFDGLLQSVHGRS